MRFPPAILALFLLPVGGCLSIGVGLGARSESICSNTVFDQFHNRYRFDVVGQGPTESDAIQNAWEGARKIAVTAGYGQAPIRLGQSSSSFVTQASGKTEHTYRASFTVEGDQVAAPTPAPATAATSPAAP